MPKLKLHDYILLLQKVYEAHRNSEQALAMSAYMKNLFPFLGIPSPARKEIFKQHLATYGLPEYQDLFAFVKSCYAQPEREYHYFAVDLASKFAKKADESFVPIMEYLITHNSWWDSVDSVSGNCARHFFKKHTALQAPVTRKWMDSGNMWLQRSALIFQLGYKQQTNEQLLFRYINELKHSKEFFIQKAIGWALREYAKTHPVQVQQFVATHTLAPLSKREATKHIKHLL